MDSKETSRKKLLKLARELYGARKRIDPRGGSAQPKVLFANEFDEKLEKLASFAEFYHYDRIIFLDRSARPIAEPLRLRMQLRRLERALLEEPLPKMNFVAVYRMHKRDREALKSAAVQVKIKKSLEKLRVQPNEKVLIVDEWIDTGESLVNARTMLESLGIPLTIEIYALSQFRKDSSAGLYGHESLVWKNDMLPYLDADYLSRRRPNMTTLEKEKEKIHPQLHVDYEASLLSEQERSKIIAWIKALEMIALPWERFLGALELQKIALSDLEKVEKEGET